MAGKTTLFRPSVKKSGPRTVIFAGNGIFQNGWDPLKNAIREHSDYLGFSLDYEIFLLRVVEEFRLLVKGRIEINQDAKSGILDGTLKKLEWPEQSIKIRNSVANKYTEAGDLIFHKIPKYVEEKLSGNAAIVTSNWDQTLWNYSEDFGICHVHGRCKFPESLIFPTEYVRDTANNHMSLLLADAFLDHFDSELINYLRLRQERLNEAETITQRWLDDSENKEIILWGIGLHTYDAEIINSISFMDWSSNFSNKPSIEKITVVNPDTNNIVIKRTFCLFKNLISKGAGLYHLNPDNGYDTQPVLVKRDELR